MFILEAQKVKKWTGSRLLFTIDCLQVSHGEKIGIVGRNGAGKTTLLRVLAGEESAEGNVTVNGTIAWIKQDPDQQSSLSGGEETKRKITHALNKQPSLLLADEPTSHLDIAGVKWLEEQLIHYSNAMILVSHDRALLDSVCTRILDIDGDNTRIYNGNYQSFLRQKTEAKHRKKFEYQQVEKEKKRLLGAAKQKKEKTVGMKRPPKRMGTSESRLYKAGKGSQMAKVDKQVKALETRIAKMEKVEKQNELPPIQLDLGYHRRLEGKIALRLDKASKSIQSRSLFQDITCSIPSGSKVAIIGKNGAGKSTLLQMIMHGEEGVKPSPQAKMGFFHQKLTNLDPSKSILENVKKESNYPESLIRTILARLYFFGNTIFQQVRTLSGGEKVKVLLANIFLSDANVLLLDEPTNFLDIPTQEELEKVLSSYPGTVLFASHDQRLISNVATHLLVMEDNRTSFFSGTYDEYLKKETYTPATHQHNPDELLLLQHESTEIISRLSLPLNGEEKATLEKRYQELLEQIKIAKTRKG